MKRNIGQAFHFSVAAALMADCSGSQPLAATPQSRAVASINTVARQIPLASSYRVLHSFGRHPKYHGSGGANPGGGLIDVGGTLYGTTEFGGYQDNGVVYSITTRGAKKVLYRFRGNQNNDGAIPAGDLVDVNGTLYGTTGAAGGRGCTDTVYSITTVGTEKVLHDFCSSSSSYGSPTGGVVNIKGTLYGTAGPNSSGIVYSVTTSGEYSVLYKFQGPPDGDQPAGNPLNVNGTLYGVTLSGGAACPTFYGCGTVYSITTSGKEKVLYSFQGGSDGLGPSAGLIDVHGTLYGVTAFGGAPSSSGCNLGCGTVYSVSTSGKHKVLYRFTSGSDAARPDTSLVELNGTLYGTTAKGGLAGLGTIYSVTTSGSEQVLHSFGADGADPEADLIAVKNALYGTTYGGGSSGCKHCGTVFALTP